MTVNQRLDVVRRRKKLRVDEKTTSANARTVMIMDGVTTNIETFVVAGTLHVFDTKYFERVGCATEDREIFNIFRISILWIFFDHAYGG